MMDAPGCHKITLGIVDNDVWTLRALVLFIRQVMSDVSIIWAVASARNAMDQIGQRCPDVLLADMSLGQMDGVALTRKLRLKNQQTGVVAMTSFPLDDYASVIAEAGAQALVGKNDPESIVRLIRSVANGHVGDPIGDVHFYTAKDIYLRMARVSRNGVLTLTDKERNLIELCAKGMTSEKIAIKTGLAQSTVNNRFQRICDKLGVSNRMQMISSYYEAYRPKH
jgi:DNA-binding NarL/FixJ family response regulator